MKHNLKITFIILAMFLLTQFIGIYVLDFYSPVKVVDGNIIDVDSPGLPFGLETPELEGKAEFSQAFASIIVAFMIAISLLLLLSKFNARIIIRLWFFVVVAIALGISFNVPLLEIFSKINLSSLGGSTPWIIALVLGLVFSYLKIYKRDFFVHNFTELLVYPGISAVFVPILSIYTIIPLLILISVYDMWAVWHSGVMQKMAKYQIDQLNIFSGFFVPYLSKKVKLKLKKLSKLELKKKKIKVNIAVLGGGDVVFPIISAGVMLKTLGLLSAFFTVIGAAVGLGLLLLFSEKKKFYPAMPFITAGIFAGIGLSYLVL